MTDHTTDSSHSAGDAANGPQPSVWPVIMGLAALFLGFSMIWWFQDKSNEFSGPMLGAAIVASLIAAAGWMYDERKSRRQVDEAAAGRGGSSRFTQVITFAVAPGRLAIARDTGIIHDIDRADGALRALPGFVDLRIIASPAASGPSQVLVETTWTNREGLATYDQTRASIIDMVGRHPDDVVAGSVQVFDMEVVRDTKEISVRFGLTPAIVVLGALMIGGFMIGAGLTVFQDNTTAAAATQPAGGGGTQPAGPPKIVATDNKFDKNQLEATAGQPFTVSFQNKGQVKHNLHFYDKQGGSDLAQGAAGQIIDGGKSESLTFTLPGPGTFWFQCDLHPDQMNGHLVVK